MRRASGSSRDTSSSRADWSPWRWYRISRRRSSCARERSVGSRRGRRGTCDDGWVDTIGSPTGLLWPFLSLRDEVQPGLSPAGATTDSSEGGASVLVPRSAELTDSALSVRLLT